MSRLITFGCSLTYGHGLPDCHVEPNLPGLAPSKYAWSQLLADVLNYDCINLGSCGASNKHIWHRIVNFTFEPTDVVFILWTYPDRTSIIYPDSVSDIGNWLPGPEYSTILKIFGEYDISITNSLFISHANLLLKDRALKVFNLTATSAEVNNFKLAGNVIEHIPYYMYDYVVLYPRAQDRLHPGPGAHAQFARDILKHTNLADYNLIPEPKRASIFHKVYDGYMRRSLKWNKK